MDRFPGGFEGDPRNFEAPSFQTRHLSSSLWSFATLGWLGLSSMPVGRKRMKTYENESAEPQNASGMDIFPSLDLWLKAFCGHEHLLATAAALPAVTPPVP